MLPLLLIVSFSALPPGYEDEAWCPAGSCLRDVRLPVGTIGPHSQMVECYDPLADIVTDELWTGALTDTQAPADWVMVASNVNASFEPLRCAFEHMHGLPELPNQFETWVTCNILNKNYTTVIHEVYDQPGNRALFRRYNAEAGDQTTLYLYDLDAFFHINASGCQAGKMSELGNRSPMASSSHIHRIIGTHEIFGFATTGQREVYMGVVPVAGVPCDLWRSVQDGGPMGYSVVIDYYFSSPGWRWPSADASQVPVLLNVSGSYPIGSGQRHYFEHTYEFGHFTVGLNRYAHGRANHSFTVPRSAGECVGNVSSVPYDPGWGHGADSCEAPLAATNFVPYYSYGGSLAVSGTVGLAKASAGVTTVEYALDDIDPACSAGAGPEANSCGIHVHRGTSCQQDAGGHFFVGPTAADPWTSASYTASGDGSTAGQFTVAVGATTSDLSGRTLIVHGYNGERIACALIAMAVYTVSPTSDTSTASTVPVGVAVGLCFFFTLVGVVASCAFMSLVQPTQRRATTIVSTLDTGMRSYGRKAAGVSGQAAGVEAATISDENASHSARA